MYGHKMPFLKEEKEKERNMYVYFKHHSAFGNVLLLFTVQVNCSCKGWFVICFTTNWSVPQVVQSGGKNIELAVIRRNQPLKVMCRLCNVFFFYMLLTK